MRIHSRTSALSTGRYVGQTHRLSRALKKMSAGGHWYMSPYISHHVSPVYRPYRTSHVDTFPRAYPAHIPLTSCSHPAHVSPVSRPHITPSRVRRGLEDAGGSPLNTPTDAFARYHACAHKHHPRPYLRPSTYLVPCPCFTVPYVCSPLPSVQLSPSIALPLSLNLHL